jgi:hypothetical protein
VACDQQVEQVSTHDAEFHEAVWIPAMTAIVAFIAAGHGAFVTLRVSLVSVPRRCQERMEKEPAAGGALGWHPGVTIERHAWSIAVLCCAALLLNFKSSDSHVEAAMATTSGMMGSR